MALTVSPPVTLPRGVTWDPELGLGQFRPADDWRQLASSTLQIGDTEAALTVIEFLDYSCPACRSAEGVFVGVQYTHPSSIRRLVRLVPLRRDGGASDTLALAAVCAAEQGRFEEMHRILFADAAVARESGWAAVAERAGVSSLDEFRVCLHSATTAARVAEDRLLAERMGVTALPTYVIDRRWTRAEPTRLRQILLSLLD